MGRIVMNKWLKTKAILKHEEIRPYVPETSRCSRSMLHSMLSAYKMVYIKPVSGMHGRGVIRIEKRDSEKRRRPFKYQNGIRVSRFKNFYDMYGALTKEMGGKPYLVQKGIHMLKLGSRDFDIRVMIQLNPHSKWEATGEIGRVSHPQKVVTNIHSGGSLRPAEMLLQPYMNQTRKTAYIRRLRALGLKVATAMHQQFPGVRNLGLDYAIDHALKPWILEVNTTPDPYIFRRLNDKRIFAKIIGYMRFHKRKTKPKPKSKFPFKSLRKSQHKSQRILKR